METTIPSMCGLQPPHGFDKLWTFTCDPGAKCCAFENLSRAIRPGVALSIPGTGGYRISGAASGTPDPQGREADGATRINNLERTPQFQ